MGIFFRDKRCQSVSADRVINTRIKVKVAILAREGKFVQDTTMGICERIYNEWTECCQRQSRAVNEFTLISGGDKVKRQTSGS